MINPKHKYPNPKQIQMTKIQNRETQDPVGAALRRECSAPEGAPISHESKQGLEHLIFVFWICFGFRYSDFGF